MNENTENVISTDEKIIKTDVGAKNGQVNVKMWCNRNYT